MIKKSSIGIREEVVEYTVPTEEKENRMDKLLRLRELY